MGKNLDLEKLMETTPEQLKKLQHDSLKIHILNVLDEIRKCVEEEDFDKVKTLTFHSGEGDGWGDASSNEVINFAYRKDDELDFDEIMWKLKLLKESK